MAEFDVEDSKAVAFAALERHYANGILASAQVDLYKGKFTAVASALETLRERSDGLQARLKEHASALQEEKIEFQRAELQKLQLKRAVEELTTQKDKVKAELADAEERERVLKFELNELTRKETECREEVEAMKKKNAETVEPELVRLEEENKALQAEITRAQSAIEEMRTQKKTSTARVSELKEEKQKLEEQLGSFRIELSKIKGDPDRVAKQTQNVVKACADMDNTIRSLEVKIQQCDDAIKVRNKEVRSLEAERKAVEDKLEEHRAEVEQHTLGCETVKKSLDAEKQQHHDLLERRLEMQMEEAQAMEAVKTANTTLGKVVKAYDRVKRELKKRTAQHDAAKALLPMSRSELKDLEADLRLHQAHGKELTAKTKELRQEVDVFIHSFLKQEGIEKGKQENLTELVQAQEELESELELWVQEEATAKKHIAALRAQKALKERELKQAQAKHKATIDELRMKELTLMDLTKQDGEIRNKLKEFSKLYEVVKTERNAYVNAIQSSSQALAEMKERIKILHNEVDILQNESAAKDKALDKEILAHQTACVERDGARLELNRKLAVHRAKQVQVKHQIDEIDKLNSIINNMEREMLSLKKRYEVAVERRNFAGIQLIDRNDELCILYEKSNVHEMTMAKGNAATSELIEKIRMAKLEVAELQREIQVTRKILPTMPELAAKILSLQKELAAERDVTEKLCRELETPDNPDRWRPLEGEDPDEEQLLAKIQVLEERLNDKKEQLLEKDLVLEEVTSLSDKLRAQASEGREGTLQLAQQVNTYQAMIKDTTRRMMAVVSELSMYQATAMKLASEKEDREAALKEATTRFDAGEAPTTEALQQWRRMERRRLQRHEDALLRAQQGSMDGVPETAVRTTAEPRPNAYIREDVGLPQPYGRHAPFKPAEAGSTMRHYRKPQPKEIEI